MKKYLTILTVAAVFSFIVGWTLAAAGAMGVYDIQGGNRTELQRTAPADYHQSADIPVQADSENTDTLQPTVNVYSLQGGSL